MEWNSEVDVLCTGSGVGGIATAIASVDAGVDVFVADADGDEALSPPAPARARTASLHRGVGIDVLDPETNQYFDALSEGLAPVNYPPRTVDVPIRVIEDPSAVEPTPRSVEPFVGARLRDWAARCLGSPYGFLYTRVSERKAVTMRSPAGESFEVASIGSVELGPDRPAPALAEWLFAQARERGIEVCRQSPLQRIVFDEDGDVLGAVLDTPSGACAVRATRGVLVSTGGHDPSFTMPSHFPEHATMEVCILRQTASRFGRVELLTTQPLGRTAHSTCRPMNRRLTVSARETRERHSQGVGCRELHRYPPFGQ
jgi:hypothetical protein